MSEITIEDLHLCLCIFRQQLAVYCKVVTILHHINISRGWFGSRIIGLQLGMWGSGQENCLFMIQQRLWTRTDAVANWKMNENWQVSQGNQSDRIGFQYGNAGEMITWKLLQHISDFSFLRDNGLVCPLGLTRCSASKGKSTKSRMKVPAPEMFINIVVKGLKRLFSQPPF